jgi:hypothetical protein
VGIACVETFINDLIAPWPASILPLNSLSYSYVSPSVQVQTCVTSAYMRCYIRAKSGSGFLLRLCARAILPSPSIYRHSMPTLTIPASIPKRKAACVSCRQRKKKCDVRDESSSNEGIADMLGSTPCLCAVYEMGHTMCIRDTSE